MLYLSIYLLSSFTYLIILKGELLAATVKDRIQNYSQSDSSCMKSLMFDACCGLQGVE